MLQFSVLGSGSGGNSAVARTEQSCVLIDAGLSAKQLVLRLEKIGVDPDEIDGILLTHEHGDHTRGMDVFLRQREIPVYCNVRTREVLARGDLRSKIEWKLFDSGDAFEIGDLGIQSFYVPHDAVEPMGYVVRNGQGALGVLSDVGHVTNLARDHLQGIDTLYVEANYDEVMLQNDVKRPWSTKQRISSRHGHLSNTQAAELVVAVAHSNLHRIVLGHLSGDCNSPEVAERTVRQQLLAAGVDHVDVCCAMQNEVLPLAPVVSARRPAWKPVGADKKRAEVIPEKTHQLSLFDF
ncbi:MAG: phosphoribosyl 1,2-cyclic phosphodiesterase [Verrucomicrobiales bacterium]|jgi:phosphoribosyl 1,2-cyclic phosphodiesterase